MLEDYDYSDLLVEGDLSEIDPLVDELISAEEDRQSRKLVLIPSESVAPLSVREALGSVFNNVYAEGYPRDVMQEESEENLADLTRQLTHYRRYANRRFYKGTEFVDIVESLAGRRAKEAFATEEVPPEEIQVNVQPLSGTAANLAVYDSFVEPGDTVMGMALDQGGHLSHGSEFNLTGKRYDIVSYSVNPETGRLDYEEIRRQARKSKPKMIIAGYTSYSWAPDWEEFRSIADEVGAVLLADISHTAGMAIAGAYPNPVGTAHVTVTTTHKTIAGPRGAIILTTDEKKAEVLEQAIFPGSQGGPHPNKFAAMATAFRIAGTESFRQLQQRIVDNAKVLSEAFQSNGLDLAYGGTDTHLMVIDLTGLPCDTGFVPMGEVASRILDEVRIVTNKNTIPGDESAAVAHGLRLGTPWVTQRGMGASEMEEIADLISEILCEVKYINYEGRTSQLSRGKIKLETLCDARERVGDLLEGYPPNPNREEAYPHFYPCGLAYRNQQEKPPDLPRGSRTRLIEVRGHRPTDFMDQVSTRNLLHLENGRGVTAALLDEEGEVLDRVEILRDDCEDGERYFLLCASEKANEILEWFRGISDGYVLFDKEDYAKKVEGPVKVFGSGETDQASSEMAVVGPLKTEQVVQKLEGICGVGPGEFAYTGDEEDSLVCYRSELDPETSYLLMKSGNPTADLQNLDLRPLEHKASEQGTASKLYEQNSQLFDLETPYFVGQGELESQLEESQLPSRRTEVFSYSGEGAESENNSTPLLDKHEKLGAKIAPFAGWQMPIWYSTIQEEHRAVRETAGLFDVGHMAVFEVRGPQATEFLDCVSTNYVGWMKDKEAQYTYFLDPEGKVLDDAMIYRLSKTRYLVVANAANADRDWEWLNCVNSGDCVVDLDRPWVKPSWKAQLVDLHNSESGEDRLIDLALQGPNSRKILKELSSPEDAHKLDKMARNELDFYELAGIETIVARTGYSGEPIGYELLVHPDEAPKLWDSLLESGQDWGIKPAGLGARDSTRIEAGLPLYGHELGGRGEILPTEAGFGAYVKLHKPFFVGRDRYHSQARSFQHVDRKVIRFSVPEGARMIREDSPVFDEKGRYLGYVTSCAKLGDGQVGMAYVTKNRGTETGSSLQLVPSLAGEEELNLQLDSQTRLPSVFTAEVLPRFPETDKGVPGMDSSE